MEVITVNLVVMVFDQVFIGLTGGSTEAKIGTQGSNPCPSVFRCKSLVTRTLRLHIVLHT